MEPFEKPAPRLGVVLHYVIARTTDCEFGAIKLNKAVCRADADFYRRYSKTITGAESFQKQRFGPVPNGVLRALKSLRAAGKVVPRQVATPSGVREEYVSQVEPDIGEFSAAEIDVMNIAIASLQRISANAASEQTHDALWDEVEMFGQISIRAAAFTPTEVDQETLAWALAAKH